MRKIMINTLAALSTARRLFTTMGGTRSQEALVTRDEVKPAEREQPPRPNFPARQQRRRESKPTGKRARRQRQRERRRIRKLVIAFLVTTLGTLGSLATFYEIFYLPPASVSFSAPLNPSDPFTTPFVISNDGYLSLREVQVACTMNDLKSGSTDTNLELSNVTVSARDQYLGDKSQEVRDIAPKGQATTTCDLPPIAPITGISSADISIRVSYRLRLYPLRKEQSFRFLSVRGSDNRFRWIRQDR